VSNANKILALYGVEVGSEWGYLGYLAVYVIFNILATFEIYWAVRERRARVNLSDNGSQS
jgi:ATP-binding cassette, subfamily G (WHITE), member 2, PDR